MRFLQENEIQPVPIPRFVSPRKRIPYHHDDVQEIVSRIFGPLMPRVEEGEDGKIVYGLGREEKRGILQSIPADPGLLKNVIGPRLASGYRKLLARVERENLSEGIKALLLNFRVPDPEVDGERYRVFSGEGVASKAFICWAFEDPRKPFIPIEEVIEKLAPGVSSGESAGRETKVINFSSWRMTGILGLVSVVLLSVFFAIWEEPVPEIPKVSEAVREQFEARAAEFDEEETIESMKMEEAKDPQEADLPPGFVEKHPEPSLDRILVDDSLRSVSGDSGQTLSADSMVLNK